MILAGTLLVFLFYVKPALQSAPQSSFADPPLPTSFASTISEIRLSPYSGNLSLSITPFSSNRAINMSGRVKDATKYDKLPSIISGVTPECDTTTTLFDSTTISETETVTMLVDCQQTSCSTITAIQTFTSFIPSIRTTTMTVEAPMPSLTCTPHTTIHWFTYRYTTITTIESYASTMITTLPSLVNPTATDVSSYFTQFPGDTVTVHSQVSYFITTWFEDIRTLYSMPGVIEPSRRPDITFAQPVTSVIQNPSTITRTPDPDPDSPKTQIPLHPTPSQDIPAPPARGIHSLPNSATLHPNPPNRVSTSNSNQKSHPTALVIPIPTFQFQPSKPPLAIHPAPSGPVVILPNGETLKPGHATQQGSLHISFPADTRLPYVIVNGHSIAKTQLPTLSDGIVLPLGAARPTRELSSTIKSLAYPYIITLPNGEILTPGISTRYNNHTFFLSLSDFTLSIDGEVVENYYAVTTEPGSKDSSVLWTVEIPGEDREFLLLAPKEWREDHRADVIDDGTSTVVVVDGEKKVTLDMERYSTAFPGNWEVAGGVKGVVGTERTGGTVSLVDVTIGAKDSGGVVTTSMVGAPSGESEMSPSGRDEKGAASWSAGGRARGRGLVVGVIVLHALHYI